MPCPTPTRDTVSRSAASPPSTSDEGIISPGGVGYDINCGVRLLRTEFTEAEISPKRKELLAEIFKEVPAGVGKGGVTKLSRNVLKEILVKGAEWAVENGYGTPGGPRTDGRAADG